MKAEILATLICCCIFKSSGIELVNQWNLLDFNFPPEYDRKDFKPENTVFTGVEVTDNRVFITIPRLRPGVPATICWIPKDSAKGSSPILQAYPDWSFHGAGTGDFNCSGIISVYRARVDSCNRLWVLDAGTVDTLGNFMKQCDPKILIFDLSTDKVVRTIIFPQDVQRPISVFTNLIIDESVQGNCDSAFVYISDSVAPGIVVFDGATDKTWRFSDPPMFPNPDYSNIRIGDEQFTLMDGIIGLAHSPQLATLFFQALATDRIFSVPTAALRKGPPAEFEALPIVTAGRKSSQGLAMTMNENDNTLFFSPITETSVATWNAATSQQDVLAIDPRSLQFVADLRWKQDGTVYILSSRFHKFFRRTVTPNEVNLRILKLSLRRNQIDNNIYNNFPFPSYYFK